jgi:hypothetical protein
MATSWCGGVMTNMIDREINQEIRLLLAVRRVAADRNSGNRGARLGRDEEIMPGRKERAKKIGPLIFASYRFQSTIRRTKPNEPKFLDRRSTSSH